MAEIVSLERIVSTILIRDSFRYQRMTYAVRVLATCLTLLAISVAGNVALMGSRERFQYLMTDEIWRLMRLVPLDQPNMSDEDIKKWAVDAVTRINTFDFANFRWEFRYAQRILTGVGWDGFQKALAESGNFTSVMENRYVTTAVPAGPAVIESEGGARGSDGSVRWTWVVSFPMIINYRSSQQTITQTLTAQATIIRMPEFVNRDGLGIRQIIGQQ